MTNLAVRNHYVIIVEPMEEQNLNQIGRQVAINLDYLMAQVDFTYNRHQRCLVCNEQFQHHIDGLPCVSDTEHKQIIRKDRWGHIKKISK